MKEKAKYSSDVIKWKMKENKARTSHEENKDLKKSFALMNTSRQHFKLKKLTEPNCDEYVVRK